MAKPSKPTQLPVTDLSQTRREIRAGMERTWAKRRKEILLDLANLRDGSAGLFRRRFGQLDVSMSQDDQAILRFRDQLQVVWRREVPAAVVLQMWVKERQPGWEPFTVGQWADGRQSVWPNYLILSLTLAIGVAEHGPKMAMCENAGCPQRYFLKGRKTQRFCDRPACIACGQREHKRKWWNEHGKEWKKTREMIRGPRSNKHRKGGR